MKPVAFPEANSVLTAPAGMENCEPLPTFRDGHHCISCWELTDEEITDLVKTRRLWLFVWGFSQPPVALLTTPPFVRDPPTGPT